MDRRCARCGANTAEVQAHRQIDDCLQILQRRLVRVELELKDALVRECGWSERHTDKERRALNELVRSMLRDQFAVAAPVALPRVVVAIPPSAVVMYAVRALVSNCVLHETRIMEDDFAYGRLLTELWNQGETFIVVEHDIVPWLGALEHLAACPQPYCAFPYRIGGGIGAGLGCTKIAGSLLRKLGAHDFSAVRWDLLDGKVSDAIAAAGRTTMHLHFPPVTHMHVY
jgi:hypothetical protein